jgi:pyruvate/2-oxoglutarate dehydrogenase complex dihydrolipoamide dehydrogenase (E3) component
VKGVIMSAPDRSYDLVVIGGGPGGGAAAETALKLHGRVAVVEQDDFLGGT